jgi:hypothetical protein
MKIMKKGVICIFVCMLMILSAVVPISGIIVTNEPSQLMMQRNARYDETEKIFSELKIKLDTITTKQEALVLVNNAIVELNEHGLLPNGMSVRQAQRLVTGCFSKSELEQPFQENNENTSGNTNCLVIGIASQTTFIPYPALIDTPSFDYLIYNSTVRNMTLLIFLLQLPYVFRFLQPFKFGAYAQVGGRYKAVENGNTSYDDIYTSSGWVWTLGMNGVKKWNGTFYGGLYTKYYKMIDDGRVWESWDPIGIRGFVGINFFNFVSFIIRKELPSFCIGFARQVNFTYSPPWT